VTPLRIPILMYHQVGTFNPLPWVTHGAKFCEVRKFRAQMRLLHQLGYDVIGLAEALRLFSDGQPVVLERPKVVLTFDDGFANFAEYAWPILREFHYPATVYVLSRMLNGEASWLKKKEAHARLLDAQTIRRLHAEGVSFGSHGCTHRRLAELSADEQHQEIAQSRIELEQIVDAPILDFCYPYGSFDETSLRHVCEAGYRSAVTCEKRAAESADSPYVLPRIPIQYQTTWFGFWRKLKYG